MTRFARIASTIPARTSVSWKMSGMTANNSQVAKGAAATATT
ncbi:hypothetical protein AB0I89_12965 [Micromonospora sp. NPDC049801]